MTKIFRCDVGYGHRGAFDRWWLKVLDGKVVACAHAAGFDPPAMPDESDWRTENLKWHLSHFPSFDPTAQAFGNAGGRWEEVAENAIVTGATETGGSFSQVAKVYWKDERGSFVHHADRDCENGCALCDAGAEILFRDKSGPIAVTLDL